MATKNLAARLKLKYDLYANWITNDPVLLAGEAAIAVVPADAGAVQQEPCVLIKIGDGTKKFSELQFVSGLAANVYSWALQSTKPSYTAEEIAGLDAYISGKVQDTNTTYKIEVDASNPNKFQLYKHELGEAADTWTAVGTAITIPADTLVTGTEDGTIKFNGTDIKIAGLNDAAYTTVAALNQTAKGYADDVLGKDSDASTANTVYGAKKAAAEAKTAADGKVASVGATTAGGIEIKGTATAPTVGIKLDPNATNLLSMSSAGLLFNAGNIPDISMTKKADSGDYAAVYQLTSNGTPVGVDINIPKDMVVQSGEVVKNPTGQPKGTYIVLTLANATSDKLYINVDDLIEYVTGGTATDGIITTTVSDDFVLTATINNGTITKAKLATAVQTSLGLADTALQKADITTGAGNGSIAVDGTDVPVKGLGTAAYKADTAFDAAGAAAAVLGTDEDAATVVTVKGNRKAIGNIQTELGNKIDTSAVSAIGKSGNVNDIIQTEGDYIILDCGSSSVLV